MKAKEKLILTAKELFWKFGIKRVTVEEICEKAEVSKMTFYRNFSNKFEICKAVLDGVYKTSFDWYEEIMAREIPFPEKIEQTILLKLKMAEDISTEFLNDLISLDNTELQSYLATKQQEMLGKIMADYKTAQENGEIRKDLNINLIPMYTEALRNMLSNPALASMNIPPEELTREMTNLFFYGIMPRA